MKTVSFRASDNFMDKYDKILSLEEQEECPLKKSEIFDEMINLYYAKKVLGDNTDIMGEEIDRIMKDNLSMFSERIAVMVNSVHGVMDEIKEKVSEKWLQKEGNHNYIMSTKKWLYHKVEKHWK